MLKQLKVIYGGILLLSLLLVYAPVQASVTWQETGGPGASEHALVIDPTNSQIIYAGTDFGGAVKSTNGGSSWSSINSGLIGGVDSLAIDPTKTQTIYAGTQNNGVFKSINGGASWSAINNGIPISLHTWTGGFSLAIDPANSQTIYVGTNYGVFKSTNGGASWFGVSIESTLSLAIDPINSQIIYSGTGLGIYKSINGGISWSEINSGLTDAYIRSLAIDPTNSQIIYAGAGQRVFKSTNGGASWSAISSGLTNTSINALAIDPTNSQNIFAGTEEGVFKSNSGGTSWSAVNSGLITMWPKSAVFCLTIDPTNSQIIYAGTYGNVFKGLNIDFPAISGMPATSAAVGTAYTFAPLSIDATSFSISGNVPPGLNFNAANGTLTGIPTTAGTYSNIVITATSATGSASMPSFFITVYQQFPHVTWQQISGPTGGYILAFAIDPTNTQIVYAGTNSGGIFKSTNGGSSWGVVNSGLTNLNMLNNTVISSLTIDPTSNRTIYAATNNGVFKSTNGGSSWIAVNSGLAGTHPAILAIDPTNSQTLYAGTSGSGVFKSTNGGNSWSAVSAGLWTSFGMPGPDGEPQIMVSRLAIAPSSSQTIYAGVSGGGVFKSTNGGNSWSAINNGLSDTSIYSLAIDPTNSQTIYAAVYGGLFKSSDGGTTWGAINNGFHSKNVRFLVIDPNSNQTIFAGTSDGGLFKSTTGGGSWSAINSGLTSTSVEAFVIDPSHSQTIYAGTYGSGVFKSTNGGSSWSAANSGLTNTIAGPLVIDPINSQTIFAGTDRGGLFKSINNGGSWSVVNTSYSWPLVIDPTNSQTIYAGGSKSTDGGSSWSAANSGLTDNYNRAASLAVDPSNSQTIYAGTTKGVFKSTNGGSSWSAANSGLLCAYVNSLAIDPTNSQIIYAGGNCGVVKSINGGSSWSTVSTGLTASVKTLAIDPTHSQTIYAGARFGVFKSTNGGSSWSAANTGLTPSSVEILVIDPTNPLAIYAGTWGYGVFQSIDGGGSWRAVNSGLTNANIISLAIDPTSPHTVYVGTSGSGVFKGLSDLDVPTICGLSNGGIFTSAPVNNLCNLGTPSSVAGSGPWDWTCSWSVGGTTASCSANKQSGALGSFDHFEITDPTGAAIGPQQIETPFSIKITAKDGNGNVATGYNGSVTLSGSLSTVAPTSAVLANGTVTLLNRVTVDRKGFNQTISALGSGVVGRSWPFTVGEGAPSNATLSGVVRDGQGVMMEGASVALDDGVHPKITVRTNSAGEYQFFTLAPGRYNIQATDSSGGKSGSLEVFISNEKSGTKNLTIWGSICNPTGRIPILLVPGTMGSSVANGGPYPVLPKDAPDWHYEKWDNDSWGLHDPDNAAGWRDMLRDLVVKEGYELGCTLFPAPYDWRMKIDDISTNYLEKQIINAKSRAGTAKVNIIAHSMGGLVTRSYIQSSRYTRPEGYDIDKFAIVGTPNHGSANAYYLWQGGDPVKLDRDGNLVDRHVSFYTGTVNNLHYAMKNEFLYSREGFFKPVGYNQKKIRDFIQGDVESAKQLMPTYGFLADSTHSFSLEKDPNTWLKDLNNVFEDRGDAFDGKGTSRVTARIFAGDQTDTISVITVGKPNDLYVDGVPEKDYNISSGDGTVLTTSIHLRNVADFTPSRESKHSELINVYKDAIISFMKEPSTTATAMQSLAKTAGASAMATSNHLTIFVQGRVNPYLTDPNGRKSGISPVTNVLENGIPSTNVSIDQSVGAINIDTPLNGTYALTLFGPDQEDSALFLSYLDQDQSVESNAIVFNSTGSRTISFNVDSTKTEKITINHSLLPPTGLQADAVETPLLTRLSWQTNGEAGVTKYHVYSRLYDEPYLYKIGEAMGTTYDTGHPWITDALVRSRLYAVAAVKGDGSESFLSTMVRNDDRDHDGLTDVEEEALGTNPANPDGDGDGFSDLAEYLNTSNPLDPTSIPMRKLDLAISGQGIVQFGPGNTACNGPCNQTAPLDSTVTLTPNPAEYSIFSGWSGDCSGSGNCSVVMDNDKTVTATFNSDSAHAVRWDVPTVSYFSSLLEAYSLASSPVIIKAWGTEFSGDVTFGANKAIKIRGGYNSGYTANGGKTVLRGVVRIRNGSVRVENLIVQ